MAVCDIHNVLLHTPIYLYIKETADYVSFSSWLSVALCPCQLFSITVSFSGSSKEIWVNLTICLIRCLRMSFNRLFF